jgi:carbamoyltransferase
MTIKVLGINYGGHDTSACIMINGKLIAACEQERYDYDKHSRNFPLEAINDCLKIAKIKIKDLDVVALGTNPATIIKERYLKKALYEKDRINFLLNDIEKIKKLNDMEPFIRKKLNFKKKIEFHSHHLCHLASTYYPSGFKESLLVSYDGTGEIDTGAFAHGKDGSIKIFKDARNQYPNSLGLIYSAITYYLGWKHHCDEGIIMGLAPYGNPHAKLKNNKLSYIDIFRKIILYDKKKDELKYIINPEWISYHKIRDKWVSDKFIKTFGKKKPYTKKVSQHVKNIAAALQFRLEEVVLSQLKVLKKKKNSKYLCISGGVGLNCSLNGKIRESNIFKEIFIQPASGDAGVAYGACLLSTKKKIKNLKPLKNHNFYVGFRYNKNEIKKNLKINNLKFKDYKEKIYEKTSEYLEKGKIIGWYQGASEFGPRALGNRSILCKPYPEEMKDHLNINVKFREEFRPFAPSVLQENTEEYFEIKQKSPHMLMACKVKKSKKDIIPAVVHVDDTCRVQSVDKKVNLQFWNLINQFKKKTSIPVLLNTSFNIKGQPIVNTSEDAINCFLKYKIDILVLGSILIKK